MAIVTIYGGTFGDDETINVHAKKGTVYLWGSPPTATSEEIRLLTGAVSGVTKISTDFNRSVTEIPRYG